MSVRREALIVFLAAAALGTFWAGITPALQKTDETAHFAYVQAVAELGHPPTQFVDTGLLSAEFGCWYNGLKVTQYRWLVAERPPWSSSTRVTLDHRCAHLSRRFDGAMYHAFQPPAYYELGAVAYRAASGLALPSRVLLVRLVSALIGAVLVVLTYLLVRELVPGSRWAARAGALALVFEPVVMFNVSGVNPDALYSTAAAGITLLVAFAWRRGLTWAASVGIGLFTGLGLLSKANFLTVMPSVVFLAVVLWWGGGAAGRRERALRIAAGAAVAGAMFGLYALVNATVWHRGLTYRQTALGGQGGSLHRLLSYAWQFVLPRLPGMQNQLAPFNVNPFWHDFVRGIIGRFGWWDDYGVARAWTWILGLVAVAIIATAAVYLAPRIRRRPRPFLVTAAALLLFLASLVYAGYQFSLSGGGMEARYLLPVMPLWGVTVGCAVAAFRDRRRAYVAGILTALFLAHTVIAVGATVQRYYL